MNVNNEEQLRLLADSDNRALVTVLAASEQPLHVTDLAERLVEREVTVVSTSEYEERVDRTRISLHHSTLPRLEEAGLIEYELETNTVVSRETASAGTEWTDFQKVFERIEGVRSGDQPAEAEIGVVTGRESVVEHGQQLFDEAERELFLMFVSDDLLEEECVRRARNALDRDVQLYLGSRDSGARELARNRLQGATIWEPQLDWMNTPSFPRVGRLVLADRRTVMLAILDEPDASGADPEETALVGSGRDNPLVVLVRELLGPRLDHLDYQSDGFRSQLLSER